MEKVEETRVGGKLICGKRSGYAFGKIKRPDSETGICPDQTFPCSS